MVIYQYDNDGCNGDNACDVCNDHIASNCNNGCNTVIPTITVMPATSSSFSLLVVILIVAVMNRLVVIVIIAAMAIIAVITALAVTVMIVKMDLIPVLTYLSNGSSSCIDYN